MGRGGRALPGWCNGVQWGAALVGFACGLCWETLALAPLLRDKMLTADEAQGTALA